MFFAPSLSVAVRRKSLDKTLRRYSNLSIFSISPERNAK